MKLDCKQPLNPTSARRFLFVIGVLITLSGSPAIAQTSDSLPIDDSSGLTSTVFATGLNFPAGLAVLPDESLLAGTSRPDDGGYFDSVGEVVRLVDEDTDGLADEPYQIVATDLTGSVTAVAVAGDLVFVTSVATGNEKITVLRGGGDWNGPYPIIGDIPFAFGNVAHQTYGLVTRPKPGRDGAFDLFFNVGAMGNDYGGGAVRVGGLLDARLVDSSVYVTTVTDDGTTVTMSDPVLIATGLRNTMGLAFDPDTGDFWMADNGMDGLEDVWTSLSADELDVIPAGQIGGEPEDFGFPEEYTDYATGEIVGDRGIEPFSVFRPLDGSESEGVASLAFAPTSFPEGLNHGFFAGFHGQFDLTGIENEENPLLYVDLGTREIRTFVPNDAVNVGHLDSLASTDNALFVADFCADGSLGASEPCGVIYRIVAPAID